MADLPLFDPYKALEEIRRQRAKGSDPELSQKLSQTPAREKSDKDQSVKPTLATLATLAGGSAAHDLAPARVKEEERKENSIKSYTYARKGGAQADPTEHERPGAARVARVARDDLSRCEQTNTAERPVARVFEGGLREWRAGLAQLDPEHPPCPGYRAGEWPRILSRALAFLDTFGAQAEALGWTAPRLFGAHPEAGIVRVDACGALVLPIGGAVRAITATEISFGHLTYREKPGQPVGLPWWEFGR